MPTYEYACTACDERLEVVQKFSDAPLTVCTECGGKLRKLFSAVGIVFKGSGFYRTDSRSSGTGTPAGTQQNGSGTGAQADSGSSSQEKKSSGEPASSGEAKPEKKAGPAAAGGSPATGSKVA